MAVKGLSNIKEKKRVKLSLKCSAKTKKKVSSQVKVQYKRSLFFFFFTFQYFPVFNYRITDFEINLLAFSHFQKL